MQDFYPSADLKTEHLPPFRGRKGPKRPTPRFLLRHEWSRCCCDGRGGVRLPVALTVDAHDAELPRDAGVVANLSAAAIGPVRPPSPLVPAPPGAALVVAPGVGRCRGCGGE
eukprot:gene5598-biopygen7508